MDRVLALDLGHRDLGDEHQEDCLAQTTDEGEEGEGDDPRTQRAQAERSHHRAQGVGRCWPGPGERFLHWSRFGGSGRSCAKDRGARLLSVGLMTGPGIAQLLAVPALPAAIRPPST